MKNPLPLSTLAVFALLALPVALAGLTPGLDAAADPAPPEGGAADAAAADHVFVAQKCNMCHSIEAAGIARKSKSEKLKGPDLSAVGASHEADWIVRYLKQQETIDGEKHDKPFKGSDEELAALAGWLATLDGR